ncbi:MAG: ABC transporter ATP-binding protein/permease, partial [Desulfobacterales bacterium]|nr:ABC transporter ATP-binding protein/permease [Desulfobacterales bacterium]
MLTSRDRSGFLRLLQVAGPKKNHLVLSALMAVAGSLLSLVPCILIYRVMILLTTRGFSPADISGIRSLALWACGFTLLRFLIFFGSSLLSHAAAFEILYGLRTQLTRHLGRLPMGYFTDRQSGALKKVLYDDVEKIEHFIAHHIPDLTAGIAMPVIIIAYLFHADWRMALVTLIPLPLAFLLQYTAFGRGSRDQLLKQYHDSLEQMNGTIVEYVRGMPVVKIFNRTADSYSRLRTSVLSYRDLAVTMTRKMAPAWAVFTVITASGLIFILPFGLWFYLEGIIDLPVLLLFLMLGSGYLRPLFKVAMLGSMLSKIVEGVARVDRILAEPAMPEPEEGLKPLDNSICFNRVCFGYGTQEVLHDLSFTLPAGSVTALVGPSGAGKTTIARLMLRMWNSRDGRNFIGGRDIRDITTT